MAKLSKKTDNADLPTKLELRRTVLRAHMPANDLRVFDCCQGSGMIWKAMRCDTAVKRYWGVDVKQKAGRLMIDSRRMLKAGNLGANVIDIDSYGTPWDHYISLLPHVTERSAVFLTHGHTNFQVGREVLKTVGLDTFKYLPVALTTIVEDFIPNCFFPMTEAYGLSVVAAYESHRRRGSGIVVRYFGIVIEPAGK